MGKSKNTNDYEELEKQIIRTENITKEIKKLNALFKEIEPKVKKAVQSLIENVAFMAVTLRELRDTMNIKGLIAEYQNGENQFGVKKSAEVDIYNTMIKNYISGMKQLNDYLPKDKTIGDDGFEAFISGK